MSKRSKVLLVICGIAILGFAAPRGALAGPFDGTYTGKRVLTKGDSPNCPREDDVSVTIKDNALILTDSEMKNIGMGFYPQPDGSFDKVDTEGENTSTIRGRIVGNTLDADVAKDPCQYHWHLEKKP